jgi:hypothetical protein
MDRSWKSWIRTTDSWHPKVVDTMLKYAKRGVAEAQLWAEILRMQIVNRADPNNSGSLEHP